MKTCSDVPKGCIVDTKVKKECFFKRRSDMTKLEKESGNTNILRGGSKSVPLKMFEKELTKGESIYEFGAGKGGDMIHLCSVGHDVTACDPNTTLGNCKVKKSDVVINNYVINTVRPPLRKSIMQDIADSTTNRAYISARRVIKIAGKSTPSDDGIITGANTFQKAFTPIELKEYGEQFFKTCKVLNPKDASTSSVVCRLPIQKKPEFDLTGWRNIPTPKKPYINYKGLRNLG